MALCQASAKQSQTTGDPPIRVSMEVMASNVLQAQEPEYPEEARVQKVQGDVVLEVNTDVRGHVDLVRVVTGHPMLRLAALHAVNQWRYRPYMLNGEPVAVQFPVIVKFRIPGIPYQEEPRSSSEPYKTSSGVMQGLLQKRVDPHYPEEAKLQHIMGDVVLSAVIDKEGKIQHLKVVSGDPILAKAAMDAVQQWRYRPYELEGKPVDVQTTINVRFHM
jgi:TonB family protein